MGRWALATGTAICLWAIAYGHANAAPDARCYMIAYTYGAGNAAFQVRRYGKGYDEPFTFAEIMALVRQNAQSLGYGSASATPTGIFPVGCDKGS